MCMLVGTQFSKLTENGNRRVWHAVVTIIKIKLVFLKKLPLSADKVGLSKKRTLSDQII